MLADQEERCGKTEGLKEGTCKESLKRSDQLSYQTHIAKDRQHHQQRYDRAHGMTQISLI